MGMSITKKIKIMKMSMEYQTPNRSSLSSIYNHQKTIIIRIRIRIVIMRKKNNIFLFIPITLFDINLVFEQNSLLLMLLISSIIIFLLVF